MREAWKDEGNGSWEKSWREVGMNEEDVMETTIMHLCIPDYEEKEKDVLIVPSWCSFIALSILLNEKNLLSQLPLLKVTSFSFLPFPKLPLPFEPRSESSPQRFHFSPICSIRLTW